MKAINKVVENNGDFIGPSERMSFSHLAPIHMGEAELKDFPAATREEMEELWFEEVVMQAELRMM